MHPAELERAIAMIARRRRKVDDRNRHLLPDAPDADPREILDYLQRHSGSDIPLWVLQADVCDALTLNNWLWWEDRRRELHFLTVGRDRGLFLSQLGAQVGVGKQGVQDRIDRLTALLRFSRPDEKLSRAARKAAREADVQRPAEERWVQSQRAVIEATVADLIQQADAYGLTEGEREWIDQLAVDAGEDISPRALVAELGLAAAELRTAPAVLALYPQSREDLHAATSLGQRRRPHRVHAVLAQADALRSGFASLASGAAGRRASATSAPHDSVAG